MADEPQVTQSGPQSRSEFPTEEFVATEMAVFTSALTNGDKTQEVIVLDLVLAEVGEQAVYEDCHVQIAFDKAGFLAAMGEAMGNIDDPLADPMLAIVDAL